MVANSANRVLMSALILYLLTWASGALAERLPAPLPTPIDTAKSFKAEPDTTWLYGGQGSLEGTFQDAAMNPDWQGWVSQDRTGPKDNHWHSVSAPEPTTFDTQTL